jgi:hypothetical protein
MIVVVMVVVGVVAAWWWRGGGGLERLGGVCGRAELRIRGLRLLAGEGNGGRKGVVVLLCYLLSWRGLRR